MSPTLRDEIEAMIRRIIREEMHGANPPSPRPARARSHSDGDCCRSELSPDTINAIADAVVAKLKAAGAPDKRSPEVRGLISLSEAQRRTGLGRMAFASFAKRMGLNPHPSGRWSAAALEKALAGEKQGVR